MNSKQIIGIIAQETIYKDYYIKMERGYFLSKKSLTIGAISRTRNIDMAIKRTTLKEMRKIAKLFGITLKKYKRGEWFIIHLYYCQTDWNIT